MKNLAYVFYGIVVISYYSIIFAMIGSEVLEKNKWLKPVLWFIATFIIVSSVGIGAYYWFSYTFTDALGLVNKKEDDSTITIYWNRTDIIYLLTLVATLIAPVVLIWSLNGWKEQHYKSTLKDLCLDALDRAELLKLSIDMSAEATHFYYGYFIAKQEEQESNKEQLIKDFKANIDPRFAKLTEEITIKRHLFIGSLNKIIFYIDEDNLNLFKDIEESVFNYTNTIHAIIESCQINPENFITEILYNDVIREKNQFHMQVGKLYGRITLLYKVN